MQNYEVTIDSDESGFWIVVWLPNFEGELEESRYLIANPEQLYDQVRGRIGPWLHERDEAKHRAIVFRCDPDESAGAYEITDPKHPEHLNVMSDIADVFVYDQERDR